MTQQPPSAADGAPSGNPLGGSATPPDRAPSEVAPLARGQAISADPQALLSLLEHRYPFLMIDRLLEEGEGWLRARKCVSFNESYFQGHFPGYPIMPGVLILEGMAQTGCAMIGRRDGRARRIYLAGLEAARFKKPAFPGDVLIYECRGEMERPNRGRFVCQTLCDGRVIATATLVWIAADGGSRREGEKNAGAKTSKKPAATAAPDLSNIESEPASADPKAMLNLLRHRYPFLLVDRALLFRERGIIGRKCVSFNEPFFQGHFPGEPIMPGVLILEGMAQAGCLFLGHRDGGSRSVHLAAIENARFKRPVHPGDVLIYDCELVSERKKFGKMRCQATIGPDVVASAEMFFAYADK
jgi:3-hydroxyacyl-[acyl-carrier-protein] dehydratase